MQNLHAILLLMSTEKKPRGNPNWGRKADGNTTSGNPKGKHIAGLSTDSIAKALTLAAKVDATPTTKASYLRNDDWANIISGMGVLGKDKRLGTTFYADVVTYTDALELWRGDDLAARIVETYPDNMLREGWNLKIDNDADGNADADAKTLIKAVETRWHDLGLSAALHQALCYENALGGAAILLGANDGSVDLALPLVVDRVRDFSWLTVLEPRELSPISWYTNPRDRKFGQPEIYQITPIVVGSPKTTDLVESAQLMKVHESRLIIFPGIKVSRIQQRGTFGFWGDSVFTRCIRVLRDFNAAWAGAGVLVTDFAQPVFKMQGLAEIMESDNRALFQSRMQAIALAMSTARAVLIDTEEDYSRQQTPVTGLPELLNLFIKRLCAAADIPVSIMFGESPGGLNAGSASGDQVRMFYDRAASKQEKKLLGPITLVTELIMQTMGGEPDSWCIEFEPLWQESAKEQADTAEVDSRIDKTYFEMGAISAEEIRDIRGERYHISDLPDEDDASPEDNATYQATVTPTGAPLMTGQSQPTGSTDIAKTAMNGAQVTSLIEVVSAVNGKTLARESGKAMLMIAFQLSEADADRVLGPVEFEPAKQPTPPSTFGGGAPTPAKPDMPMPDMNMSMPDMPKGEMPK